MAEPSDADKYMLVLDDRVFYSGLLGRMMKPRKLGALAVFLAPKGPIHLKFGSGPWTAHDVAIVPPYQQHHAASDCGRVIGALIEPERLGPGEVARLVDHFKDPARRTDCIDRLRCASQRLARCAMERQITKDDFDRIVIGRSLAYKNLDTRIDTAMRELDMQGLESQSLASDIADGVGLSTSRFLHLFKEQTGVSFRSHRMWRRARTFLLHANHSSSLTDVALSLGYPDSSHFSHSIRRTFGLKPSSIRDGSQALHVDSGTRLADAALG